MSSHLMIVFFFTILFIFCLNINNINEYFQDFKGSDYEITERIEAKLLETNFLKPQKIFYTLGKSGEGKTNSISTIGYKPTNIKSLIPDTLTKYGTHTIVNLKTLIPFLWHIIKNQNSQILDNELNFEKIRSKLMEIKKKM